MAGSAGRGRRSQDQRELVEEVRVGLVQVEADRARRVIGDDPRVQVAPLLAAFNTAYVTSPKNLQGYAGLQVILKPASPIEAYVYRVDGVAPRAFVAPALEPVTQPADAIEYLRRSTAPGPRFCRRSNRPPAARAPVSATPRKIPISGSWDRFHDSW